MTEHVPTTEQVREVFALALLPGDGDQTVPEGEFDRWLAQYAREAQARALEKFAAWCAENGGEDAWAYSLYAEEHAAALRNPNNREEPQVGDVVPLREEWCNAKHEEPFRFTSGGNGSSSVHYCTLQKNHGGGKHYDGVSGKDWR